MFDIEKSLIEAKKITETLLSSPSYYFKELVPSNISPNSSGVYVIFNEYNEEVLYVGRTKNLRTRLYTNHLHGPKQMQY